MDEDSEKQVIAGLMVELRLANEALAYQDAESEKRAAELMIVNEELAFQITEKDMRTAELLLSYAKLNDAINDNRKIQAHLNEVLDNALGPSYKHTAMAADTVFTHLTGYTSAEMKNEQALKETEERLNLALRSSGIGTWYLDIPSKKRFFDDQTCALHGIEPATFQGTAEEHARLIYKEDLERVAVSQQRTKERGDPYESEYRVIWPNGSLHWIRAMGKRSNDTSGRPSRINGVIWDITESKLAEERILQLSFHDSLTGLYNRRFYEVELKRLDTQRNLPLSFIIGDVNGLKLINDSFGHAKGDELLQTVANALKKECRADDILVRLSGDEFAVLLPKTDSVEAERLMNRFHARLKQEHIGIIEVSVAFGSSTKVSMDKSFELVFKTAEDAMYRNKVYESQSIQNKTISLIMASLLENNQREQRHSQRVSELCVDLARRMGQNETDISRIRLAGLMHDIGKIGLRAAILNKNGILSPKEKEEMQLHPEIGNRILSSVSDFSEISDCVLQHHEHWDGKGYPNALKGESILLSARIISVVDAFDAMTFERTYHKSYSDERAIAVLKKHAGSQFDPDVVSRFIEMLESRNADADEVLEAELTQS